MDNQNKKLLFILNPKAGRTQIKNRLFDIINEFTKAGYDVITFPTQKKLDARDKVIQEGKDYDIVVCAGGDGTLDEVISGYMVSGCKTPIGYIPAGTTNDFAKSLKISKMPMLAVDTILNGHEFLCDIGSFNNDYFVYIAAFGAFTEVSYSTPQIRKNMFGHAAYVLEGAMSISSIKSYNVIINHDGKETKGEYIYGMVSNSLSVGGFKNPLRRQVKFDDGEFEVMLVRNPQDPLELQKVVTQLLREELDSEYFEYYKTSKVTFTSETPIPWSLDGEFGGECYSAVIENHKQSIKIMRK